jgi:predicted RNA methylase
MNSAQDNQKPTALLPGTAALIDELQHDLESQRSLRTRDLIAKAEHHLGFPLGDGRYDFRYLFDALETALHRLIESRCKTLQVLEPAHIIDYLEQLLRQLPTQRVRTNEQALFQQFSAPAPLAFTANFLAFLGQTKEQPIVLEPSAGTAALACVARGFGAQVITNDLSTTRQAFLRYLNFKTYGVDAENLNDLLPLEVRPDLIIMNPPFSSTAGRLSKNDNKYGARHIQSALYRLQEQGRLVAITGSGMALDRQKASPFWQEIASRYNVRLNLTLPSATFAKFGTTWTPQLIVIDKTGATPGQDWSEQVDNIRHGEATLLEILTLARDNQLFIEAKVDSPAAATPHTTTAPTSETATHLTLVPNNEPEVASDDDNGFVPYIAARLTGGINHPAPLVETASMAAVTPPPITYRPWLDPSLITSGALSNVQLERICYAGQRHEQRLPTGARPAYLVGDGTGFGKGRCLAGIIIDNYNQGRTRTLWLSISNQLLESTRRDLHDLGASQIALNQLNDWDVNGDLDFGNGVIFCSYNTLIAKSKITEKTRMEQLIEWLGQDGIVIFDECQRAQHALATTRGEATQTGTAVVELQDHEKRPDLRFIYSSATSLVEVNHLCYMTRLGLWGEGTCFPNGFGEFSSEIAAGGLGALEMVTRSMKANGMSNASTLSYGIDPASNLAVEYQEVFHELTDQQREIYDNAAAAWQVVLQNIDEALELTNAGPRQAAFAKSHFWAQHQAFFRQVITAFKVPECINQIELALTRGESAIVSVIGTAEAKSKKLVAQATAEGGKLEDLDFSPRATLCALAERAFPVDLYQQKEDPATKKIINVRVTDESGNPVQSQEALRLRTELLERLSDLVLPENPLDQIINYFGAENVAEISGRRKRLMRNPRTEPSSTYRAPPRVFPCHELTCGRTPNLWMVISALQSLRPQAQPASPCTRRSTAKTNSAVAISSSNSHGVPSSKCRASAARTDPSKNARPGTFCSPPTSAANEGSQPPSPGVSLRSARSAREIETPPTAEPSFPATASKALSEPARWPSSIDAFLMG